MQSNTSMTYKEELLLNLKDKEYRTSFVEAHINNGIAFQIKTMRGDLTQEELGMLAGMKQEAICRLENPNYGSFTLKTLKQIASAFDVALIVRFVPFSDLINWDLDLSAESLKVLSFDEDLDFKKQGEDVLAKAREMLAAPTQPLKPIYLVVDDDSGQAQGQIKAKQKLENFYVHKQKESNIMIGVMR